MTEQVPALGFQEVRARAIKILDEGKIYHDGYAAGFTEAVKYMQVEVDTEAYRNGFDAGKTLGYDQGIRDGMAKAEENGGFE